MREMLFVLMMNLSGISIAQATSPQRFQVLVPPRLSVSLTSTKVVHAAKWSVMSSCPGGVGLAVQQSENSQKVPLRWVTSPSCHESIGDGAVVIVQSAEESKISLYYDVPKKPVTLTITFLAP